MDDSDDDFVTIGAPLQPLLDDEVPKKPKHIQQQTVTDAQGRRRFHGAFTGGFSAGFFNTVGSKEGWTPSAFVSARDRTSEEHATEQRPEDFMDDEDFGEYGIAPRQLTVSNDFQYQPNKDDPSGTTSTRDRKRKSAIAQAVANRAGIIPGLAPLESLVVPSSIPLGIQLLRKLGWKEGQGIGPRVRKPTRRKGVKDGKKVYGCSFPSQSLEDSESSIDEDFAPADVTFAPKDVCPIKFRPKNDLHGLGYSGINVQLGQRGEAAIGHISLFEPQAVTKKPPPKRAPRRGMMGAAFGVGALEDDDDEDVYAIDSMSNYDRVLTDASDKSYGWTAPKHTGMSSAPVGHLGKVLEGFKLSTTTLKPRQIFPPPTLPRDYKPIRKKTPGPVDSVTPTEGMIKAQEQAKKISFSLKPGSVSTEVLSRSGTGSKANAGEPASGSRQKLDAHARGAMLGEIESVFDLVKIKDKQRIEAMATPVTNREVSTSNTYPTSNLSLEEQRRLNLPLNRAAVSTPLLPQTGSITATLPTVTGTSMTVPTGTNTTGPNDTSVTGKAVPGSMGRFQPFAKDPTKQKRYERFLELRKLGVKYDTDVPGMTEWERQREREDFTRAAALYRPLAAGMASRFTPAQYEDDAKNVTLKKEKEAVDKRTCAVELKMFGRLTRETKEWHPDKQLCKLFNVANPYPGSSIVGIPGSAKGSASFATFDFAAGGTEQGNEEEEEVTEEDEERSTGKATDVIPADIKPLAFLTSGGLESLSGPSVRPESTGGNQAGSYVDLSEDVDSAEVKDEKVERPALDIFKAIFSSSESESEESDLEVTEVKRSDVTIPKVISDDEGISGHMMRSREEDTIFAPMESEPRVPDRGSIAIESLEQRLALPGEGSTGQGEGQGHASFATPPDEIGDYGPALPPTFNTPANGQDRKSKSPKKKRLHKDRHKERKKKKDKHKKNKSKDKKKKKKKDRKKEVVMVSSSSSGSEADEDTDSDTDNQSIIDRLKNHPELKRMTAADFM